MSDNCLNYALRCWWRSDHNGKTPRNKIFYNSDHCINAREEISGDGYLPIEDYGIENIMNSFSETLDDYHMEILKLYFDFVSLTEEAA